MTTFKRGVNVALIVIGVVVILFGLGVIIGAHDNGWQDTTRNIGFLIASAGAGVFTVGFLRHMWSRSSLPQTRARY